MESGWPVLTAFRDAHHRSVGKLTDREEEEKKKKKKNRKRTRTEQRGRREREREESSSVSPTSYTILLCPSVRTSVCLSVGLFVGSSILLYVT